jgi:hypothetical protein
MTTSSALAETAMVCAVAAIFILAGYLQVRYCEQIAVALSSGRPAWISLLFIGRTLKFSSLSRAEPEAESLREGGLLKIYVGVAIGVLIVAALCAQAFHFRR